MKFLVFSSEEKTFNSQNSIKKRSNNQLLNYF